MMKINKTGAVLIAIMIAASFALAGCGTGNSAEDDMAIDLGGDVMNPGDDENDDELVWNDRMPDSVPEFTDGTIVQSSFQSGAFGTQSTVTMGFESVTEDNYDVYISAIEGSIFTEVSTSDSGGIRGAVYADGENILSTQYAVKSGQLVITYSFN